MIVERMIIVALAVFADCDRNSDTHLNPEDVMLRAAQRAVLVHVSVQVNMVNPREIAQEVLLHAIQGVNELVV